jgi:peptidoglycan/LPS O-acetylase OafA/YrhL
VKLTYRPEIDGLRAIAVFSVILYHSNFVIFNKSLLSGGFLGVDIFFVISGYLITSIILKEIYRTNNFFFINFYERRVRRIIPTLLFVMLCSLPFGYLILFIEHIIDFSKSIISSIFFISNIYFNFTGNRYGAEHTLFKPFFHTWSLSVEEQFYILFPIFLIILFKFLKKYLFIFLSISFLISISFSQYSSIYHPGFNFYQIFSRGFELLLGSLLSYFELNNGGGGGGSGKNKYNRLFNLLFPKLGISLIIFSIFFFTDEDLLPSFYSLIPLIGVCLIVWFSHKDEIVTKILSNKIFVFFGLISYSLYLFHYPIFAFSRALEIFNDYFKFIFIFLTIIVSIFSYYFIERPFRSKNITSNKQLIIYIFISFIILFSYSFYILKTDGIKSRYNLFNNPNYELNNNKLYKKNIIFETSYNYNDYDVRKNVLIVGNSHAEDLLRILSKTNLNKKIYFNLTSPEVRKNDYNYQISYFYKFLTEKKAIINSYDVDSFNHLNKQFLKSDLIILSSQYTEDDLDVLDRVIKHLKFHNKKIIIFDNALNQTIFNKLNRLDNFVSLYKKFPDKESLKIIEETMYKDLKNKKEVNLKIKRIAKENQIPFIERERIFCDKTKKRCPSITEDGYKIYYDYSHITLDATEFFSRKIENDKLFIKYLNFALQLDN